MSGVVYDAGALIAAERNDRALGADHRVRLEQGIIPIIPAAVIAEASWLSRQAQLRRLLRGCDVADLDENIAHRGWDSSPTLAPPMSSMGRWSPQPSSAPLRW